VESLHGDIVHAATAGNCKAELYRAGQTRKQMRLFENSYIVVGIPRDYVSVYVVL
jgi:hypothetical protein